MHDTRNKKPLTILRIILGLIVMVIGIVLLILPGPGLLLILLGLGIIMGDFRYFKNTLAWMREKAAKKTDRH